MKIQHRKLSVAELITMHDLMVRASANSQLNHSLYVGGPTWSENSWKTLRPLFDLVLELEDATDSVDVSFNSPERGDPL